MSIRLYEGDNKPLGSVTIRTKGNQSKAGATIALAIDCVARADGTVELVNNNESANPGALLYTADEKVQVVEGGGQSQTNSENIDFSKTFDDVFGDLFKSKPETAPEQEPTQADEPALRIFVSHASSDANYAQTVVSQVEGQTSRKCWVAPRDVRPGFRLSLRDPQEHQILFALHRPDVRCSQFPATMCCAKSHWRINIQSGSLW